MKIVASMRDSDKSRANREVRKLLGALGGGTEVARTMPLPLDTDLFIQWGYKPTVALKHAMTLDIPYVIVDLGYFDHDRASTFSLSINGFHGMSMANDKVRGMGHRPRLPIRQWRDGGENVIILGQMPLDQSLFGQDIEPWMGRAATAAVEVFGKKVIKRPHPRMLNPWEPQLGPLEETFDSTYVYVSWTSTAAIQTVAAGIPTICAHPGNMAYDVGSDESRIRMPGRETWMHDLSHRQYDFTSVKDVRQGAKYVLSAYDQAEAEQKEIL